MADPQLMAKTVAENPENKDTLIVIFEFFECPYCRKNMNEEGPENLELEKGDPHKILADYWTEFKCPLCDNLFEIVINRIS